MGRGLIRGAQLAGASLAALALAGSAAALSSSAPQVSGVHLSATWNESWLTASVHFTVNVANPGSVTVTILPADGVGNPAANTVYTFTKGGAFTESIKLPPRLLPKAYLLETKGPDGSAPNVGFTLPAPAWGIVDQSTISTTEGGKAIHTVASTRDLWVRFHFLVRPPQATTVTIAWRTPSYTFLGKVTKPVATTVVSRLSSNEKFPPGIWYAILTVAGKTATRAAVRVT